MFRAWLTSAIVGGTLCLATGCAATPATPARSSAVSALPATATSMSPAASSPAEYTATATGDNTRPPMQGSTPRPPSTPPPPTTPSTTTPTASGSAGTSPTLTLLAALPIKGRAPMTGYSRAQFGDAWTDDNGEPGGHNGCDTRNDILRRDLITLVIKADSNGCTVLSGTLHDVYTATTMAFTRGVSTSDAVQIDHLVALGDAWQTGAQQLSAAQRTDLANDPRNLQAVDGPTNEAKGDGDAASWLPPNKSYRCTYLIRQIQVKTSYHLWVTAAEKTTMQQQLSQCPPAQPATTRAVVAPPTVSGRPTTHSTSNPPPPSQPVTTPAPAAPATTPAGDVYYQNCAAVKAAGKAPLHTGQPGYRAGLDRDHDGTACET